MGTDRPALRRRACSIFAVFVLIGLFVSARSKTSVTSLVLCLFLWVAFVFLVPALSFQISPRLHPGPSADNLDRVPRHSGQGAGREESGQAYKAQDLPKATAVGRAQSGDDGYHRKRTGMTQRGFEKAPPQSHNLQNTIRIEYADISLSLPKRTWTGCTRQARDGAGPSRSPPRRASSGRSPRPSARPISKSSRPVWTGSAATGRSSSVTSRPSAVFSSFAWLTPTQPGSFQNRGCARLRADGRRVQDRPSA